MAYVLAKHLCVTPCKVIGKAMEGCCDCCGDVCDALGRCCNDLCDWCGNVCCVRPFSSCLWFTGACNLLPIGIIGYVLAKHWDHSCEKPLHTWLLLTVIMFIINCIFAVYLFARMNSLNENDAAAIGGNRQHRDPDLRANNGAPLSLEEERRQQYERGKKFFLYDPFVALFIILGVFQIVWAIMGLTYANADSSDFCDEYQNEHTIVLTTKITAIGYLIWIPLGVLIILLPFMSTFCGEIADDCGCDDCCLCIFCWPCYIPYMLLCADHTQRNRKTEQRRLAQQQRHQRGYQGPTQASAALGAAGAAVGAVASAIGQAVFGKPGQSQQQQQQQQQQPAHAHVVPMAYGQQQQQVPYGQPIPQQQPMPQTQSYPAPQAQQPQPGHYPPPVPQEMSHVQPSAPPPAYDDASSGDSAIKPSAPATEAASSQPAYGGSQPAYGAAPAAPAASAQSSGVSGYTSALKDGLKGGLGKAKGMFGKK